MAIQVNLSSVVRQNMMNDKNYTPYCGKCNTMARTVWNGNQMECKHCQWTSEFEYDFIKAYKDKHNVLTPKPL